MASCVNCGERMGTGARFCSTCGRAVGYQPVAPPPQVPPQAPPQLQHRSFPGLDGLYRPRERRMLAGVCAGFALRYGWDLTVVRLVLVLSVLCGAGIPLLAYAVLWVIMPQGQYALPAQASVGMPGSMGV